MFLVSLVMATPNRGGDWVLELDNGGIQIYTKQIEGSKYKQVKGVAQIDASLERVAQILTDYANYMTWANNVTESYIINSTNDSTDFVYTYQDSPWPVQNRYEVSRMVTKRTHETCVISFDSEPNYLEKRNDAIEMKYRRGHWKLAKLPNGGCSIELFIDQNPGGHLPAWLLNSMIIDSPFKSLANLQSTSEKRPRP